VVLRHRYIFRAKFKKGAQVVRGNFAFERLQCWGKTGGDFQHGFEASEMLSESSRMQLGFNGHLLQHRNKSKEEIKK